MSDYFFIFACVYLWLIGGVLVSGLMQEDAVGALPMTSIVYIFFLWPFIATFSFLLALRDDVLAFMRRRMK